MDLLRIKFEMCPKKDQKTLLDEKIGILIENPYSMLD
jgi:hypothetical protein